MNLFNALQIKGYMMPNELEWLANIASKSKCIVEIGTFYGRSARALADNTDGKVYCIDPYPGVVFFENGVSISSGHYVHRQAQKNLQDHIESGKLTIHHGTVEDFPYDIAPDFVFIDGDHHELPFRKDLNWAEKKLRAGVLSGHDYENSGWPDVTTVVNERFPTIGREGFIWWITK